MNNLGEVKQFDLDYIKLRYKQYLDLIQYRLKNNEKPHNRKWKQGFYIPKNPQKCMNIMETPEPQVIIYRSGWEQMFMEKLDSNTSVIRWGSEISQIVYKDPIKNKQSFYVPDFYYEAKYTPTTIKKYLIEIKPSNETRLTETKNGRDKLMAVKNYYKWVSAIQYCKKRNIEFKVLTEKELFR